MPLTVNKLCIFQLNLQAVNSKV